VGCRRNGWGRTLGNGRHNGRRNGRRNDIATGVYIQPIVEPFKSLCRQAGLPPRQKNKILPAEFCYIIKRSTKFVFSSLIPQLPSSF